MKKRLLFLMIVCLGLSWAEANAQNNRDWANFKRYEKANNELPAPQKKEKRVIFLGNSITEGWVRHSPDFFKENGYIGRGISGQTSYQFLLRFREDVINLQPKLVVINAGTNDIAENTGPYDEDKTFGNIVSMAELAKANKIKVILTSVLPHAGFSWNRKITNVSGKVQSLNARIKAYAKKNKIAYADYWAEMVFGPDGSMGKELANDGVHPTQKGYKVMEAIIKPIIDKAL